MQIAIGLYLLTGVLIARKVTPMSFPFGRNAVMVTLLWPWPVAAHLVSKVTGKYPSWTPPL